MKLSLVMETSWGDTSHVFYHLPGMAKLLSCPDMDEIVLYEQLSIVPNIIFSLIDN